MKLIIEVDFPSNKGLEMVQNLNKAIDELSKVLKRKGLCEMELTGVDENLNQLYKVNIQL